MDLHSYLRSQRLSVDNPYDQEGMLSKSRVSQIEMKVVFDNFYYVPKEKIYCHVCGGHRHRKGITGLFDDGSRILFGSKCARDYFGPEVAKLCSADLRRKTRDAVSRYRVLEFRNSTHDVENWLNSYRPLVNHCQALWVDIRLRHGDSFDEVTDNIRKNGGRLVETSIDILTSPNGKQEHFHNHRILLSLRSPEAIPYLTKTVQQLSLIDAFIVATKTVSRLTDKAIISRLSSMFNDMRYAAEVIDSVLSFTSDFFSVDKLNVIGKWIDDRRLERLRDQESVTPRDTAKLFSKIAGIGIESPTTKLSDLVSLSRAEQILLKPQSEADFSSPENESRPQSV